MQKQEDYLTQIDEWEYCYCRNCRKIRYNFELEGTEHGIRCTKCGGYELEAPAWVHCPHHKVSTVKCARAGKGIRKEEQGYKCEERCSFRKP